jgi:hypothetical protein
VYCTIFELTRKSQLIISLNLSGSNIGTVLLGMVGLMRGLVHASLHCLEATLA